ncbi:hypothetical protein [Micromonospora globbae]|uniref:hypothetical protein n=1 Tax=Micromonospora globbae TaxID=1894969 RepID=UPI003446DBA7
MRTRSMLMHRARRGRFTRSTLAAVLGVGATLVAVEPARAEGPVTPMACVDMGWHYRTFSKQDLHIPAGIHFKSGPGGTVGASIQYNLSTTFAVSSGISVSASAVVLSAEGTFGINASVTSSLAQSYTYSRTISSGKYGNLQFGNWGWRMGVEKYYMNSSCVKTDSVTGTVTRMPSALSWGYRYWETSS